MQSQLKTDLKNCLQLHHIDRPIETSENNLKFLFNK
jgi:hypothetical protein